MRARIFEYYDYNHFNDQVIVRADWKILLDLTLTKLPADFLHRMNKITPYLLELGK